MRKLKPLMTLRAKGFFIMKLRKLNYRHIMILRKHQSKLLELMKRKLGPIKLQRRLLSQMLLNMLRLRLRDKLMLLLRLIKKLKILRLKHMLLPQKLPKLLFKITN